jgi:hypothetical protein
MAGIVALFLFALFEKRGNFLLAIVPLNGVSNRHLVSHFQNNPKRSGASCHQA